MKKRYASGNSKKILVFGIAAMLSVNLCTNYIDVNADSEVYAYKMDDIRSSYCIVDFDDLCVYMYADDTEDSICYKMDITSEDTVDSLNAVLMTEEFTMPISIQFKDVEKEHALLVMQEAYEYELKSTDLETALDIMADKTIMESTSVSNESESISDVISDEGQIRHRNRIMGDENRINAVIEDIKFATGETISFEKADFIKESLDLYTDSSRDIKGAYNNPESEFRPFLEELDYYLNNVTKWHGTVMRGMIVSKETANEIMSGEEPVDMKGPSSWTSNEMIARSYARDGVTDTDSETGIVFVLEDNKSGASITHLSLYGITEAEVLAPSGIQYLVDSYETVSDDAFDFLYVYVHEKDINEQ